MEIQYAQQTIADYVKNKLPSNITWESIFDDRFFEIGICLFKRRCWMNEAKPSLRWLKFLHWRFNRDILAIIVKGRIDIYDVDVCDFLINVINNYDEANHCNTVVIRPWNRAIK
jgi:hypothetical protein